MRVCRNVLPTRIIPTVQQSAARRSLNTLTSKQSRHRNNDMSLWHPRTLSGLAHPTSAPGFSGLFRMLDDFEKYAQSQVGAFGGTPTTGSGGLMITPKFDVTEHDKDYVLQGELPGVPTENVEIEFTDPQTLVIRGHAEREHTAGDPSLARIGGAADTKKIESGGDKKKQPSAESKKTEKKEGGDSKEESAPKYWLSERSFGEFSRVFNFPSSVDQDKVEAKFRDGILDIKVPKMERKGTRKITLS
ncbi:HSP20-like chaperone [Apodospora peruviana]|uniref:HSP20-like chaperone n=1 Tax=Apodospora peruviana TaxID=516989 RepID=A0AAE0MD55_9PEZI|nr:HSP20-like chaperone [Apodospora peruviana]